MYYICDKLSPALNLQNSCDFLNESFSMDNNNILPILLICSSLSMGQIIIQLPIISGHVWSRCSMRISKWNTRCQRWNRFPRFMLSILHLGFDISLRLPSNHQHVSNTETMAVWWWEISHDFPSITDILINTYCKKKRKPSSPCTLVYLPPFTIKINQSTIHVCNGMYPKTECITACFFPSFTWPWLRSH